MPATPPQSAEELLRRYATWELSCASANLNNAELSGATLRAADLRYSDFGNASRATTA